MDKWEYKRLLPINSYLTLNQLNKYGELGWELIQKVKDIDDTWTYIFKRKITQ